eukprot:jgi/Mesvir1/9652/Mv12143-RA.2
MVLTVRIRCNAPPHILSTTDCKVVGDTIYNALRLGEGDTDADDRPLEPHRVLSAEVLWNPFEDVAPRDKSELPWAPRGEAAEAAAPSQKRKKKKELHLLSFGEEAQEEEREVGVAAPLKIKSSHDVLTNDPRLLRGGTPMDQDATPEELSKREALRASVRRAGDKSGATGSGVPRSLERDGAATGADGENGDSRDTGSLATATPGGSASRGAGILGKGRGGSDGPEGGDEARRDGGGFGADAGGSDEDAGSDGDGSDDARDFDALMRQKVLERQRQLQGGKPPRDPGGGGGGGRAAREEARAKDASIGGAKAGSSALAAKPPQEGAAGSGKRVSKRSSDDSDDDDDDDDNDDGDDDGTKGGGDRPKAAPLRLKKGGGGPTSRPRLGMGLAVAQAQDNVLSEAERQRLAHRDKKRSIAERQKATMERLAKFQQGLKQVHRTALPAGEPATGAGGGADDDDEGDWRAHALKFAPDASNKDSMARKEDVDDYVVHDPLLEKGKEKFNKEEAKRKRRNREWVVGPPPKG